jgi:hypothetical protein
MVPATPAGRHARRLLSAATEPPASIGVKDVANVLLVRPRRIALSKVTGAAFGNAARRRLTFSSDSEIRQCAREVVARQDLFLPSMFPDAAIAEAVLRRAVGRGGEKPKWRYQNDFIRFAVLTDLCTQMNVSDVDELIAAAELRSGVRPLDQSDLDAVLDQLTTDIGRLLMRASMTGETNGSRIPGFIEDNHAVLDATFELASIRMLGRPLGEAELDTWAARVARLVQDVSLDEIKAIVKSPYAYSISAVSAHVERVFRVRAASSASVLMCLLASEALDVLKGAEQLARKRGFEPEEADGEAGGHEGPLRG